MSGVSINIRVDDAAVRAALDRLRRFAADPAPALKTAGEALITSTQERIRDEVSPDGARWPALRPDYAEAKRSRGMLIESGGLVGSFTRQVTGSRLVVGTNVHYAAIHQFGGTIRPKGSALRFRIGRRWVFARKVTIPARPFLGISDEDREEIIEIFEEHARRAATAAR